MFSLSSSLATSGEVSQPGRRKFAPFAQSLPSWPSTIGQGSGWRHWGFNNQRWVAREDPDPTEIRSPTLKLEITEGPHLDADPATQPTAASGQNRCERSSAATRLAAGRTTPTARAPRSSQPVEGNSGDSWLQAESKYMAWVLAPPRGQGRRMGGVSVPGTPGAHYRLDPGLRQHGPGLHCLEI